MEDNDLGTISCTIFERFGFHARQEQLDALDTLICEKRDVILIARTGFGKSIVFQAAPFVIGSNASVLVLMPLIALQEEQCEKVSKLQGGRPIVLNGDVNSNRETRKLIREGGYTHG